jgi:hypothetical protein
MDLPRIDSVDGHAAVFVRAGGNDRRRTNVASQLQLMGVEAQDAQARVAAMTDSEVHALAGNINEMPAGAMAHGWWWLIAAVVIAAVVYYTWKPTR